MALPKWITPAGNLGIIPELDYYEYPLDAYDATATGGIIYSTSFDASHSTWQFKNGTVSVTATGLPYHSYGNPSNPIVANVQSYNVTFPLTAGTNTPGAQTVTAPGLIGFWINGVAAISPKITTMLPSGYSNIPGYTYNVGNTNEVNFANVVAEDLAGGYTSLTSRGTGQYHYHNFKFSAAWESGNAHVAGSTTNLGTAELDEIPYLNTRLTHSDGHSKILGWALDGYPIYGPYGYSVADDTTSAVQKMVSGYTVKDFGYRTAAVADPNRYPLGIFVEDYEFTDAGDLDQHNGRYCITPDYPEGTYAYFVTLDIDDNPVYPYVIGNTYYGTPARITQNNSQVTTSGLGVAPAGSILNTPRILGLEFTHISGDLPLGIQVNRIGKLQGVPLSERGPDQNVEYTFTIRARNTTTNEVADRTFSLTVTNISPPVIIPRDVDLGIYLDGEEFNLQLEAVEFNPSASLIWELKSGELPPGITLSSAGLISGYLLPITENLEGIVPGWDRTGWNLRSWDFAPGTISKTFVFSIEVFDGANYDLTSYRITVFPRDSLTADNDELKVDTTYIRAEQTETRHTPIILTTQSDLTPVRQSSYFSFQVEAIDLDNDVLQYTVASLASGAFDEQTLIGESDPYITSVPVSGNLFAGMYPLTSVTEIDELDETSENIVDFTKVNLVNGDAIKVLDTSGFWQEATVNNFTTVRLSGNVRVSGNVGDFLNQPLSGANAVVTGFSTTTGVIVFGGNVIYANPGDFITQPSTGANATVAEAVSNGQAARVTYTAGNFTTTGGNIQINGSNVNVYPTSITCQTDVSASYLTTETFVMNTTAGWCFVNSANTLSIATSITSVGVILGSASTEGTIGFDEGRFDQGAIALPSGLSLEPDTGWITGQLPSQTINEVVYTFEVSVFKDLYPEYVTSRLYNLTVLGDLYNRIDWITPVDLGTIQNGDISDLMVQALSTRDKPLFYRLEPNTYKRLPQGLLLTSSGLITGRVSFEMFGLDGGTTTIDNNATEFDNFYTFTVEAADYDRTIASSRTFTLRVIRRNVSPYEDLYLRAMLSQEQRTRFLEIITDRRVFPINLIYRNEDPFFGLAKDIRTLFLPGVVASKLSEYADAVLNNHFNKRIGFGEIKTARALDENFQPKYEVVYIELKDDNTTADGLWPAQEIDLSGIIDTPYYDLMGNIYTTAYPNAFDNMQTEVLNSIGYENKGALPDWMTSRQENGRVLGFKRAVVLAYTVVGGSKTIAYRLTQNGFNFNQLDFTVDRYQVDNSYSDNYNLDINRFVASEETTFDRYPRLGSVFGNKGTVNFAVSTPFEDINMHTTTYIKTTIGGLDGYKNFKDGDLLVFAEQEFRRDQNDIGSYNQGWNRVITSWDGNTWDFDVDTGDNAYQLVVGWAPDTYYQAGYTILNSGAYYRVNYSFFSGAVFANDLVYLGAFDNYNRKFEETPFDSDETVNSLTAIPLTAPVGTTPGLGWDEADYVPGYNEHNLDSSIANERIGIWRVNIDNNDMVTLTFQTEMEFYDRIFVKNGSSYGGTNIYYDPVVKENNLIPNYSIIPQQISTEYTTFDGNGTRFFNNRDEYTVPGSRDKYIKFAKTGVFT